MRSLLAWVKTSELTGVKSKHAYSEMEESLNRRFMDGLISDWVNKL